jgi:hypothetical protein
MREEEGREDKHDIYTAMRKSLNSSQNNRSLQTVSQNNVSCVKNNTAMCECIKQNILDYPFFLVFVHLLPYISLDNWEFTVIY